MKVRYIFLSLTILALSYHAKGQILDDSTQNLYGPTTTSFTYINNVKLNKNINYHPDTTLSFFHRYNYMNRYDNKLQDLGNVGTSSKSLFYEVPEKIGRTSGFYTYSRYGLPVEDIRIYNTRSPYTHVYAVFGGSNRNITHIEHSQSIKPNWSFGLNFYAIRMNKQISSTGRGDLEVESLSYNGYMYYWTNDSLYMVMGSFSRTNHEVDESGGIDTLGFESVEDYFDANVNVNMENAMSKELKMQYYLYQQFKPADAFTIYNELDRTLTSNYFEDVNLSEDRAYFNDVLFNDSRTWQKSKFTTLTNESGIKGDWKNAFYNAYFKYRRTFFYHQNLNEDEVRNETYIGGNLRYDNDSTYYLLLSGEFMNNGNHILSASYENRLWDLSYKRIMYEPGVIHERYFSNHYEWFNNFNSVQSDNIKATFKIDLKNISIRPFMSLSIVKNYIYFNTKKQPEQASGFAQLYSPGLDLGLRIGKWIHWNSTAIYSFKSGDEAARNAFRFPSVFVNSNIYYERMLFQEKLQVSFGIDGHYRSTFFADGYDAVTQQFYIQDNLEIPGYFLADLYVNLKIRTVRIMLKWNYFNQGKGKGYLATPYYAGQPKVIDLGLSWMFYD